MSAILKNGTRCVIVAGCPENIGLLVVTTEHLGAHNGREDAYRITTLSGRLFPQLICGKRLVRGYTNEAITDRYKLRPLVDPKDKVDELPVEKPTAKTIDAAMAAYEAKAFTDLDRKQATAEGINAFRFLLRKRLLSDKPLPTVGECEGMVILALDFMTTTPGRPESPYGRGFF